MRLIPWILTAGLVVLGTGCGGDPEDLPVRGEELVDLLVDVHIAEAAMQDLYGTDKDSMAEVYYQQIFYLHEIDAPAFDTTMAVLRRNPDYTARVYRQVMAVLEQREAGQ